MGDPAGIGPDISLVAWSELSAHNGLPFFVVGDATVFVERAAMLAEPTAFRVEKIEQPEEARSVFPRALPVLPLRLRTAPVIPGRSDVAHAPAIIASIEDAVSLTLAGRASAVVTNPIAKHVLLEHGFPHAGHTEFLGELARRDGFSDAYPVMLMASKRLMAVPVTVHIPLKDVPSAVTETRLVKVAEVTSRGLSRYFGVEQPRLAICGLNPHAGEGGEIGMEEIEVIAPAIDKLRSRGILASGPYSADSLFHETARQSYDAVLAMYHDQALIPFKTLSFSDGVNVTLGLPFIRTSPDHGTAYSLAGTGRADPSSFIEALRLANLMCGAASASVSEAVP
jgi:4-hydroxythreonine-4-phosphate dehydrogenase